MLSCGAMEALKAAAESGHTTIANILLLAKGKGNSSSFWKYAVKEALGVTTSQDHCNSYCAARRIRKEIDLV